MMKIEHLILGVLLWASAACSLSGPLREDPKAFNYHLGELPAAWRVKEVATTADKVFESNRSGAFLAVNSLCDRYPDSSLESLTRQLLSPLSRLEIEKQEPLAMDGREALFTRARGFVDGVAVENTVAVLRKDNCIFDFTLHSLKAVDPQDEADFRQFLSAFHYSGGKTP